MAVLVEHREETGDATVEAATHDGDPEGRDQRRDEFDVPDEIDHYEKDRERDRSSNHEPDSERFAEAGRFGTVGGVSGCLINVCVSHPPDIRHIRTPEECSIGCLLA